MQALSGAPDLPALTEHINVQHGTTYRVTERYLGGEQGAAGLTDANGNRFVLKWRPGATDLGPLPDIIKTVDRLRSRWYPVPRYVARGLHPDGAYSVQTMLPGAPIRRFSPAQIEQILALNEMQHGHAAPPAPPPPSPGLPETAPAPASDGVTAAPWPARVADDVLHGGAGYCLLDAMPRHSPETARLLDILQTIVSQQRAVTTPTTDIVHCDFQQSNILAFSGKISGVVDWDGTLAGDRAFDLTTLLFYAYDQDAVCEALWPRVRALTEPAAVALYFAHLIHRQVDWSIRRHEPAVVDQWLNRARVILTELPARTGLAIPPWP